VRTRPRNIRGRGAYAPSIQRTFNDAAVSNGYSGYFDLSTNANRRGWVVNKSALIGYVSGTQAQLNVTFAGDTTPFRVRVDGGAEQQLTVSGGLCTLFTGLTDGPHLVVVRPENSTGFGDTSSSGSAVLTVQGVNPTWTPLGVQYNLNDPAFPGYHTYGTLPAQGAAITPTYAVTNNGGTGTNWGPFNGSMHFRAQGTGIWVFTSETSFWYSINGSAMTQATLMPTTQISGLNCLEWKQIPGLALDPNTLQEVILNSDSLGANNPICQSVMIAGPTATLAASNNTKINVCVFGASQVQGAGATIGATDMYQVMPLIPGIAVGGSGNSGQTVAQAVVAMPLWAPQYPKKHTILLSIGFNSADDASFQGDYTNLINACLTAGWTRVICRGTMTVNQSVNLGKNAKIQAAVSALGNANVVYADVSTWVGSVDGSVGVMMPDSAHPNAIGYTTQAGYVARDHATILTTP
jgi:hypothetical protein